MISNPRGVSSRDGIRTMSIKTRGLTPRGFTEE